MYGTHAEPELLRSGSVTGGDSPGSAHDPRFVSGHYIKHYIKLTTLHQTNARHTAPVWRPTCSTERRRRLQSAVPAGATNAHKLHYTMS